MTQTLRPNSNVEQRRCLNIAHRGGAGLAPENTLRAFREAATIADAAELDVQLSADGAVVVFHDATPNARTCRGYIAPPAGDQKPLTAWTLSEIRALDAGDDVRGETVPLLSEVIDTVRAINPAFRLFVELKLYDAASEQAAALADATVAVLRERDFFANAVLIGFDWRSLLHAKTLAPELACWFSTAAPTHPIPNAHEFRDALMQVIVSAGGSGWFPHLSHADRDGVAQAHAKGLAFGVWTVNETHDLEQCLMLGVDAICTDYPQRLKALLANGE